MTDTLAKWILKWTLKLLQYILYDLHRISYLLFQNNHIWLKQECRIRHYKMKKTLKQANNGKTCMHEFQFYRVKESWNNWLFYRSFEWLTLGITFNLATIGCLTCKGYNRHALFSSKRFWMKRNRNSEVSQILYLFH